MKNFLLILLILSITNICHAKTYVIVNKETKDIISVSPEDDALLEEGNKKIIIEDKFKEIKLSDPLKYYKLIDGKFVKDYDKVSEDEAKKLKSVERDLEEKELLKRMKSVAFDELVKDGYEFKHIKKEDFNN